MATDSYEFLRLYEVGTIGPPQDKIRVLLFYLAFLYSKVHRFTKTSAVWNSDLIAANQMRGRLTLRKHRLSSLRYSSSLLSLNSTLL